MKAINSNSATTETETTLITPWTLS